ncbi:MAG: permease, partial [Planctomycetota bacterium]
YLLMLAIGLPIYVCASASTPLAATLIAKGLSPGAALVLLLAAPATNLGSMLIVKRLIGGRGLAVHLVALSVATVVCGALLDLVLGATGWGIPVTVGSHVHLLGHTVHQVSAVVLALLLLGTVARKLGVGQWSSKPA